MRPVHLLLYDADCGFCRWSLAWVLRWDRHRALRPVALQDERAAEVLAPMSEAERLASWHLVEPDGTVHSAGAAAPPMLRLLPGGRAPAALLGALPGIVERVYAWVVRHRGWLGRRVSPAALRRADALIAERSRLPSAVVGTSETEEATR